MKIELNKYNEDFYAWEGEIDGKRVQMEIYTVYRVGEYFDGKLFVGGKQIVHVRNGFTLGRVVKSLNDHACDVIRSDISLCLGDSVVECPDLSGGEGALV